MLCRFFFTVHFFFLCSNSPKSVCTLSSTTAYLRTWYLLNFCENIYTGGGGGGGGLAQGLGIRLLAFGGAYWPLALSQMHTPSPCWVCRLHSTDLCTLGCASAGYFS